MSTVRKIGLVFGAFFAAVIVVLLTLWVTFINPELLKARIIQQVTAQTGLQLQIKGDVSWTIAADLGLRLTGVELKYPFAGDPDALVKFPQVDVYIAWRPLLSRHVEIQKLILSQFSSSIREQFSKNPINMTLGGDLTVDLPTRHWMINHFTIDSDALHATGQVSGEDIFQHSAFSGQLQIAQLNLQQELKSFFDIIDVPSDAKNIVINFRFSPGSAVTGDVSAQRLLLNTFNFSQVTAKFVADADHIQCPSFSGLLAGGKITGQGTVTHLRTLPHYQVDAALTQVELAQLFQSGILQGAADVAVHLTTNGVTQAAILTHLNGRLQLTAHHGVLNHLDLLKQSRTVSQLLPADSLSESASTTQFSTLSASGVVNEGLFSNRDLVLQSPNVQASGMGTVNLVDEQIHYQLLVKAQGQVLGDAYALSVPLQITGTLNKPKVKVDLSTATLSLQPTANTSKQLGKTLHNELKRLFGHQH